MAQTKRAASGCSPPSLVDVPSARAALAEVVGLVEELLGALGLLAAHALVGLADLFTGVGDVVDAAALLVPELDGALVGADGLIPVLLVEAEIAERRPVDTRSVAVAYVDSTMFQECNT